MSNETEDKFQVSTLIVKEISDFINENRFDDAFTRLTSLSERDIYEHTWDLTTYLLHLLEKPTDKLCNEYELFSRDGITHLAEHGNPRELLIIMLEQSDRFISDDEYAFHMKIFLTIIKRLPIKTSLITNLNDIYALLECHLTTIQLPKISNEFSGNDLLVFNQDQRVNRLLKLVQLCVEFSCQIRDYFSTITPTIDVNPSLSKALLSILQEPLISLSYEPINNQESSSMTLIQPLLNCLFSLKANPLQSITNTTQQSVFIYLILTKSNYFSRLPCVYSPLFYLFLSIPAIQHLSHDRDQVMFTEKASVLLSTVCARLTPNKQFDQTILDNDEFHILIDTLKMLMVQSPARQYAPLTIGAYRALFQSFDSFGRYTFLRQQLAKTSLNEDSYRTFLCTLVKDEFLNDYRSGTSGIYRSTTLFQLLDYLCQLPHGIESDLLEIYDCLCSTLNFIRFIGLVDKQNINRTLIWTDYLNRFNTNLLKPLRKSIDLARAHYKLEIKNRADSLKKREVKQNPPTTDTELLVDNTPLAMPSKQEQLGSLHTAVTKFDILECILSSLSDTFSGTL